MAPRYWLPAVQDRPPYLLALWYRLPRHPSWGTIWCCTFEILNAPPPPPFSGSLVIWIWDPHLVPGQRGPLSPDERLRQPVLFQLRCRLPVLDDLAETFLCSRIHSKQPRMTTSGLPQTGLQRKGFHILFFVSWLFSTVWVGRLAPLHVHPRRFQFNFKTRRWKPEGHCAVRCEVHIRHCDSSPCDPGVAGSPPNSHSLCVGCVGLTYGPLVEWQYFLWESPPPFCRGLFTTRAFQPLRNVWFQTLKKNS